MRNWDTLDADKNLILDKHCTPGRDGARINKIILHHNAGSLTAEQIYQVWQDRQASAHYQVAADGVISQHVWDSDTAWHAGSWGANTSSIGIEHANSSGIDGPLTAETLENGAHLVAALCKYYGLGRPRWGVNVFGHKQFSPTSCPGHIMGSQNGSYMSRAQAWYDTMTVGRTPTPASVASKPANWTDYDRLARDVIAGKYGTGEARKRALGDAYNQVQARVNQILAQGQTRPQGQNEPTTDELACAVIRGEYGTGQERINRLGSKYQQVQNRVNEILAGRNSQQVNIDDLARAVIRGEYGTGAERQRRLGANYNAVQARVNQLLGM